MAVASTGSEPEAAVEGVVASFVRHGAVDAPNGRYAVKSPLGLSPQGRAASQSAAVRYVARHPDVTAIYSSPLNRAWQTAELWSEFAQAPVVEADELADLRGHVETGTRNHGWLVSPPAEVQHWERVYSGTVSRLLDFLGVTAITPGHTVYVSHQLPIWLLHLHAHGQYLFHDPRSRRCSLSSVTSFVVRSGGLLEVGYDSGDGS